MGNKPTANPTTNPWSPEIQEKINNCKPWRVHEELWRKYLKDAWSDGAIHDSIGEARGFWYKNSVMELYYGEVVTEESPFCGSLGEDLLVDFELLEPEECVLRISIGYHTFDPIVLRRHERIPAIRDRYPLPSFHVRGKEGRISVNKPCFNIRPIFASASQKLRKVLMYHEWLVPETDDYSTYILFNKGRVLTADMGLYILPRKLGFNMVFLPRLACAPTYVDMIEKKRKWLNIIRNELLSVTLHPTRLAWFSDVGMTQRLSR